jgi:hypothetical protein
MLQEYAPRTLEGQAGTTIDGFGIEMLQKTPKTQEQYQAYGAWLQRINAQQILQEQLIEGAGSLHLVPGSENAKPYIQIGYDSFSDWASGHALQMQGIKAVMTMMHGQDLRSMGANIATDILVGGESAKGSPFMSELLVNALGAQTLQDLGMPSNMFDTAGNMRGGQQPEVANAIRNMINDPGLRPRFETAVAAAGGTIETKWMRSIVDPSWSEQYGPGAAFAAMAVQDRRNAPVGSVYLPQGPQGGVVEQLLETLTLPGIVSPTESPQRGNPGRLNFVDTFAMAQRNPQFLNAIYGRITEGAEPFAGMMMAAAGAIPEGARVIDVGSGGVNLPFDRAVAMTGKGMKGPLGADFRAGLKGEVPLLYMLQAMESEGSGFENAFLRFTDDQGVATYVPPARHLLSTQTFGPLGTPFGEEKGLGDPGTGLAWKLQRLLSKAAVGGGEDIAAEVMDYRKKLVEFASEQGVVRSAFAGGVETSMTGRLQYVGGVDMGGIAGVVLPNNEYNRIVDALGEEGAQDPNLVGAYLRWPDAGAHSIIGRVMSASQARAMGGKIDPRAFRGIGFTGRTGELVDETYTDVDKDVGTVLVELASRIPGIDMAGDLRARFMDRMKNIHPDAIDSARSAFAKYYNLDKEAVTEEMLTPGAILSFAEGKAAQAIQPATEWATISDWADDKVKGPTRFSLKELGEQRAAESLGKGMIGLASNFGDMMRFMTSERAGLMSGAEKEAYEQASDRLMDKFANVKQSLVDTNMLPSTIEEGATAFEQQSYSGSAFFAPMTAQMFRRSDMRAGDITIARYGEYEMRGGRIFPRREVTGETRLLGTFAKAAYNQGFDVGDLTTMLGGPDMVPEQISDYLTGLYRATKEDKPLLTPTMDMGNEEFRSFFRKTPLGQMVYGQGVYSAAMRVSSIEARAARGEPIEIWERDYVTSVSGGIGTGEWDPEVEIFERARATLGVGGRARLLFDPLSEYNAPSRMRPEAFMGAVRRQALGGFGISGTLMAGTPFASALSGGAPRPFSEVFEERPRLMPAGGMAHGGEVIDGGRGQIIEVGEQGPEFIIDGDVKTAEETRRLKELGVSAERGMAIGGEMEDDWMTVYRGQKKGQPMGNWWWEEREKAVPFAVGGEILERQIPRSLLEQGRSTVRERKGSAALEGELYFTEGLDKALAGLREDDAAFQAGSTGGGQRLLTPPRDIPVSAPPDAIRASALLQSVLRGNVPVGTALGEEWALAGGQHFATEEQVSQLGRFSADPELIPTPAEFAQMRKTLEKLPDKAVEFTDIKGEGSALIGRLRGMQQEAGPAGTAPKFTPGEVSQVEVELQRNLDLLNEGLKRVIPNIDDLGESTEAYNEALEKYAPQIQELQAARIRADAAVQAQATAGSEAQLQAFAAARGITPEEAATTRAWAAQTGAAEQVTAGARQVLGAGGTPGGPGGGPPPPPPTPTPFGTGLGGVGRTALSRFSGGDRIMTFFDLMYLQRLGNWFTGSQAAAGEEAEMGDMSLDQQRYQLGLSGGEFQASPLMQAQGRRESGRLERGRQFNRVWAPIREKTAAPETQRALGAFAAIAGPAAQAFFTGAFVQDRFLGGEGLYTTLGGAGAGRLSTMADVNAGTAGRVGQFMPGTGGGRMAGAARGISRVGGIGGVLGLATLGVGAISAAASEYENALAGGWEQQRAEASGNWLAQASEGIQLGAGVVAASFANLFTRGGTSARTNELWQFMEQRNVGGFLGGGGRVENINPEIWADMTPAQRAQARGQERIGDIERIRETQPTLSEQGAGNVLAASQFFFPSVGEDQRQAMQVQLAEMQAGGVDPFSLAEYGEGFTGGTFVPGVSDVSPRLVEMLQQGPAGEMRAAGTAEMNLFRKGLLRQAGVDTSGVDMMGYEVPETATPEQRELASMAQANRARMLQMGMFEGTPQESADWVAGAGFGRDGEMRFGRAASQPRQRLEELYRAQAIEISGALGTGQQGVRQMMESARSQFAYMGADEVARVTGQIEAGTPYGQALSLEALGQSEFATFDVQTMAPVFERRGEGMGMTAQGMMQMAGISPGGDVGQAYAQGFTVPGTEMTLQGNLGVQARMQYHQFEMQRYQLGARRRQFAAAGEFQQDVWGVQDQMRDLSRGYQDFQMGMQGRRMDMQESQFAQNQAFAQMQAGVQADWGRQDIGIAVGRAGVQRQWRREDWAVQDDLRATQWGWQQQDFQENIRFSTGRQRRLGIRQQQRATVMHQAEEEQIDRERGRQEQREAWEDEDFNKQRNRHEIRVEWQNERFEISQQHFEEQMALNREAHEEQKKYINERRELEDELRELQRDWWKQQRAWQQESLNKQEHMIQMNEDRWKLEIAQAEKMHQKMVEMSKIDLSNLGGVGTGGGGGGEEEGGGGGGGEPTPESTDPEGPPPHTLTFRGQTYNDAYWTEDDRLIVRGEVMGRYPGRVQFGGPAVAGEPMIVGEGGQAEVFIPGSSGMVTPFNPGGGLAEELFASINDMSNMGSALIMITAIRELVEALNNSNPDKAREVDNLIRMVAT